MEIFTILVLLTVVFLIWYYFHYHHTFEMVYAKSTYDNRSYLVRNLPDKEEAANVLAYIRSLLSSLSQRLLLAYPNDPRTNLLKSRYRPDNIQEAPEHSKSTSYSVNKGENLVFCIRSRTPDASFVPKNTVVFVALHEMAHIICISQGHTPEFWECFRFLLAHAVKWKLYEPVNYKIKAEPYCGTVITDTPLLTGDVAKYVSFDDKNVDVSSVPLPKAVLV
jgi:hypothetical protein